jgi:hypothetical protein
MLEILQYTMGVRHSHPPACATEVTSHHIEDPLVMGTSRSPDAVSLLPHVALVRPSFPDR